MIEVVWARRFIGQGIFFHSCHACSAPSCAVGQEPSCSFEITLIQWLVAATCLSQNARTFGENRKLRVSSLLRAASWFRLNLRGGKEQIFHGGIAPLLQFSECFAMSSQAHGWEQMCAKESLALTCVHVRALACVLPQRPACVRAGAGLSCPVRRHVWHGTAACIHDVGEYSQEMLQVGEYVWFFGCLLFFGISLSLYISLSLSVPFLSVCMPLHSPFSLRILSN